MLDQGGLEMKGRNEMYVITAKLPTEKIEGVLTHLGENGYHQTYYEVPLDIVTDDNGYDFVEKKQEKTELHIYLSTVDEAEEQIKLAKILDIEAANLVIKEERSDHYQQRFDDVLLENGWVITTPENKDTYNKKRRIILDSQGNFGTGYHETTKDCLNYILENDFTDKTVADIGAGSGVLSIAAAIKGAQNIDSFDIQPVAREILYQCELNDVSQVKVYQEDLINHKNIITKKYDWVFLNIGTQENIDIIGAQSLLSHKSTTFILSGMLEWNSNRLVDLFENAGFSLEEKRQSNEWVTCIFKS